MWCRLADSDFLRAVGKDKDGKPVVILISCFIPFGKDGMQNAL
jgi:hypothetical protein